MQQSKRLLEFCVVVTVLMVPAIYAGWSEPVFLRELNGFENGYVASTPAISSDGLTIYYLSAHKILGAGTLYEARRESLSSAFTSKRAVEEIYQKGFGIFGAWLSHDGLGLYYAQDTTFSGAEQWQKVIRLALRDNNNGTWTANKTFVELRPKRYNGRPSLTSDELVVLWHAMDSNSNWSVHTASRQSIMHTFSNVRDVKELNDIGGVQPYISADGLAVYFTIATGNGSNIYKGVRQSRDEPFGNFEPLDDINKWATASGKPCPSPDEKTLYFWQKRGAQGDINLNGIYVSHWIDTPYDTAVKNIKDAIKVKQEALQAINKTIEKETETLGILARLPRGQYPPNMSPSDISRARTAVLRALLRQMIVRVNLKASIDCLSESLMWLHADKQPAAQTTPAGQTAAP